MQIPSKKEVSEFEIFRFSYIIVLYYYNIIIVNHNCIVFELERERESISFK